MVSVADFFKEKEPWRRQKFADAPGILVQSFVRHFARHVEAACRKDWTALPILRSVSYKFTAEHTMCCLASFCGKRGWTADTLAQDFVQAAQNLYQTLHNGFVGQGVHRVPIAGDTTKLPLANGLSPVEKRHGMGAAFTSTTYARFTAVAASHGALPFRSSLCAR